MDRNSVAYHKVIRVESLPPIPATAARLLMMAADPDVDIDDLAVVIERDPPLASRVVGIANSAFYSPRQPVTSVRESIIQVLGLNMVRNMAFGMALTGGLSTVACPRFDLTNYWTVALGTADLVNGFARAADADGMADPDTAYLAGLLHNIGELLLVHVFPKEMDESLRRVEADPDSDLATHLQALIGTDQWDAGAFLMRHWQLPPIVSVTVESLADPAAVPRNRPLVRLIDATRRWIAAMIAGRVHELEIDGVEDAYRRYRTNVFSERFDDLRHLAQSMH
jgi:HD-like signal output (HDOD) protein